MIINNIYNVKKIVMFLFSIVFFFPIVFISCDDSETNEESYFIIEDGSTGIAVDINGVTKNFVVRSNRPWKIVEQGNADWVKTFPSEGEDDGIFSIIVDKNLTFDSRTMNFAFVVDGNEQPSLFRVDQEANVPFITIYKGDEGIAVPSIGGDFKINILANVDWTYSLSDNSWINEVAISENEINFVALKNKGEEHSVTLTVSSANHPNLNQQITITQSAGNVILEENFDWLNYGSTIFYTTTGEKSMDSWTSEELDRGWSSSENTFSSNQRVVYARTGFLKLGKTGYGGDLISRPLASLDEPSKIRVTFKAVPYQTQAGTQDDNLLNVSVVGPGTININSFVIDNWPNYDIDPECIAVWESDTAKYEFIITDATAETRIKFLGGDYNLKGVGKGKNRIFLDDIKVEIIE